MAKKDADKPAAKTATPAAAKKSTATAVDAPADPADPAAPPKKKGPHQPVAIHGPDSLIDRLYPHIKKIAVGAIALFLVIGGYVGWRWMKNRAAAKDTTKLAAALEIASRQVQATPPAPDPTKTAPPEPTFPTVKARAEAAAAALADVGKSADNNALYHAAVLFDAGKLDDAERLYKAHTGDAGLDGALAREGVGYVLEARAAAASGAAEQQKLLEQALEAFKQVQPDDKGPRRDYALYDQARVLAQMNKRGEARALLDQALKTSPESEIKSDIEARMALLEAP